MSVGIGVFQAIVAIFLIFSAFNHKHAPNNDDEQISVENTEPSKINSFIKSFSKVIAMLLFWVLTPAGWIYYMWACFKLQLFGWFIAGLLLPPVSVVLGLWSFFFGVPEFMLP